MANNNIFQNKFGTELLVHAYIELACVVFSI